MMAAMRIRIDAVDLPGLARPALVDGEVPSYGNLHVAVQRRDRPAELLEPQPGDGPSATWTLECTTSTSPTGIEVKGPYVQDRLGRRFIYLSWGTVDHDGTFSMFRRAKLWLDAIDPAVMNASRESGRLVAKLGLTDAKGHPLCASVRPPRVEWAAR
jgi:uncharacterized protein DUF5990